MRVYNKPDTKSIGINRVAKAIEKFAPEGVEFTNNIDDAELIILHVNGRNEKVSSLVELHQKPYVMVQYCLRSTQKPNTEDWIPLWEDASLVWSYYDLYKEAQEDGNWLGGEMDFYHAPLGVDTSIFYPRDVEKKYLVCTTGLDYLTEGVREVIASAREVGGKVAHLGADLGIPDVDSFVGISDDEVAELFSSCNYISGLRTKEGFELPVIEGLACGVKPIVFDTHNYRQWYEGLAHFIPEVSRQRTIEALTEVFKQNDYEVKSADIMRVKTTFDWEKIVKGFWSRVWIH